MRRTSPRLDDSELATARALALYATAAVREADGGLQSDDAADMLVRAHELDPDAYRVTARAAAALLRTGRMDEAISLLEQACKREPRSLARADLAVACEAAGRTDDAVRHYRKAVEIAPQYDVLHIQLVRVLFSAKRDQEALEAISDGRKKASNPQTLVSFCYRMAADFVSAREISRAAACFEFLLPDSPENENDIRMLLAGLYEDMGDKDAAIRHLDTVTRSAAPRPDAFVNLALLQRGTDRDKAAGTLSRALARMPGDQTILLSVAVFQMQDGKLEEAVESFRLAEQVAASSPEKPLTSAFYLHFGSACEQAGEHRQAEEVFRRGLEKYPDDHAILNYLAYMWADAGINLGEARRLVEHALELEPANGAYVDTLAWVAYREGKFGEALELMLKAAALLPEDPVVLDHLGDVYDALGRREDAAECWKKSLAADPTDDNVREKLAGEASRPSATHGCGAEAR
ncbi:MAG: tetratricopeptide repeat protein [Lentisphaerae bacterium]|nr:tetratricopeptide repeat protein [Lentisphaerota bacterium]